MKNKIFLTSMLVMLMTCPAFAVENGEIDDGVISANCVGDPLYFEGTERTSGELSYTAQWELKTYNISYDLDGGNHGANHPSTYNVESSTFDISNPSRGGYSFNGWNVTTAPTAWGTGSSSSGSSNFRIATGTYGDIALKATWTSINCGCTTGTGAAGCNSSVDETTNMCNYNWSCQSGFFNNPQSTSIQDTSYTATCEECPAGYDGSDDNRMANTNCYKNCERITVEHSTSVMYDSATVHYDGSQYPTCTYDVTCEEGYHVVNNHTANPTCVGNEIGLNWYKDAQNTETVAGPNACVYGTSNGITGIPQPTKPGYTFTGWKVTNWNRD